MVTIKLLKLNHIDNTYLNIMDFSTATERDNYFNSLVQFTYNLNIKDDTQRYELTIPTNHKIISHCNYLFITDENNKRLYYFITNYTHTTNTHTTLTIQLDVYTTYQHDITLTNCFVERCHVPRWNGDEPTKHTIDEGLALGEYILTSSETITKYNDGLIIASTAPLGVCKGWNTPSEGGLPDGGGGDIEGGDWQNGLTSPMLFRVLKHFEGFGQTPYTDTTGHWTIGYGVTEKYFKEDYDFLCSRLPCGEQSAAEISYKIKTNNFGKPLVARCKELGIKTQNQFDACVSICYQNGNSAILNDNSLTAAIKGGIKEVIRSAWINYNDGLYLTRRTMEAEIFCDNKYPDTTLPEYRITIYEGTPEPVAIGYVTQNNGNGWLPTTLYLTI